MIPVTKDDYLIVSVGTKNYLCFAHNPERNKAIIDGSFAEDEVRYVDYDESTLIANLGKKPKVGQTAFRVRVEPYVRTRETDWGPMLFYRRMKKKEGKALRKSMKDVKTILDDNNLGDILPLSGISIYPKRGKYAGMYKCRFHLTEVYDTMELYPETFEDPTYNNYILMHEIGHAVWYRKTPSKVRARWISLYQERLEVVDDLKDTLKDALEDFLASDESIKAYRGSLDEMNALVFKEAILHIKRYHKLDETSLDTLRQENQERFCELWPEHTAVLEGVRDDPSSYAMTKPEEFFAECFAYHMTGLKVSKDIKKLMEKTLKYIR